jgi:Flp pilus assembly protein TadG
MATVEFAICLPVLVLIILGSIEACNMIFLKQALTEAAYQGVMVAMRPNATEGDITARVQSILDARNIQQSGIEVANGNFGAVTAGSVFTVRVDAQMSGNRIGPQIISGLSVIESTVTALKQ